MTATRSTLSGWGRYPRINVELVPVRGEADVLAQIAKGPLIARGNGRAYGDSALNPSGTLDMRGFNRMLAFDAASGQLVGEGGLLLSDIIASFLPRGWFPHVTPGTKFVTLGGMLAADVHGKNHHREGGIGNFVDWVDLACADGTVRRCSLTENVELFAWTIGGMGLTGVILRAAIRLRRVETGWIRQTLVPAPDLASAMEVFEKTQDATYSVAWIDCYATGARRGRSVVMLGEHARYTELPQDKRDNRFAMAKRREVTMPVNLPRGALNKLAVRFFNHAYYWAQRLKPPTDWVAWDNYFYPLDAILEWPRIYGRRGFTQFQCVLPHESARSGLEAVLTAISAGRSGSFLAVLKRLGAQGSGFSFPMPGYTLTLDFPLSGETLALLDKLDEITIGHGGRFYLAKDARMCAETLARADHRTGAFRRFREKAHMTSHFRSAQSERLAL
ncbi:MAG: FAD-binding oxidoreductase [Phycisphaerales bacterium]|nr:FAD-binding oxidoreductase [Hyphomonadaceae bacterium]